MVCPGKMLFWVIYLLPPSCTLIILFSSHNMIWLRKTYFIPIPTPYFLTSDKIISINMCISWNGDRGSWPDFSQFQQKFYSGCRCWNKQETLEYFLYASKPRGGALTWFALFYVFFCIACFRWWPQLLQEKIQWPHLNGLSSVCLSLCSVRFPAWLLE